MPQGVIRSYRLFFWLAIIVVSNLLFSCKDEDCVSIFNNDMLLGFYETDTLETGEVIIEEKDTTFFAIIADGNDSTFYDPSTTASVFTLPVDPASEFTAFELYMIDSVATDTISNDPLEIEITYFTDSVPHFLDVSYRSFTRVITEDCGVEIVYVNLEVDDTTFPTYEVEAAQLTRFNEENEKVNVKVYF